MIYTHVLNRGGLGVRSPADLLFRTVLTGRSDVGQLPSQSNSLAAPIPPLRQLEAGEYDGHDAADPETISRQRGMQRSVLSIGQSK
jgi:hypothetical protein